MAVISPVPYIARNTIVSFGVGGAANDFAKAVNRAELIPSGGIVTFKGGKPDAVYTFPEAQTYTFQIDFAQDWGSAAAASLSRYLFDNVGLSVPCQFNANDQATKTTNWAFTVVIVPGSVGGPIDSVAVTTVTLGVVGLPVPTLVP